MDYPELGHSPRMGLSVLLLVVGSGEGKPLAELEITFAGRSRQVRRVWFGVVEQTLQRCLVGCSQLVDAIPMLHVVGEEHHGSQTA